MSDPLLMVPAINLASNITNDSGVSGASVAAALDWLNTNKQAADATLTALAALDGTAGLLTQTGADTFVRRSLVAPAAGVTITNPAGTAGDPTFVLANDLAGVEGLTGTGLGARTAVDTWAVRSIAGTAGRTTVADGDAVAGNPTIDLATVLVAGSGGNSAYVPVITWDAYGRLTAVSEVQINGDLIALSDSTVLNVTTARHGYMVKLPNVATQFFDGVGSWRALAATDLGTTLQVQFGLVGINVAPDATYLIKMDSSTGNCLGSFTTSFAAAQAGFNLGYTGQVWRIAANASFGRLTISDVTGAAGRVFMDTSGNLCVNNSGTALGKLESRSTSTAQLAASYDGTNYLTVTTASNGVTSFTPNGTAPGLVFGTGIRVGTGTGRQKVTGVAEVNVTAVGNVGTGEDDLQSLNIPANSVVTTNAGIAFRFLLDWAGTATGRIYAGATKIWDSGSLAVTDTNLMLEGRIIRTGSNAQLAIVWPSTGFNAGAIVPTANATLTTLALTETAAITLKATGEGTSNDDIVSRFAEWQFLDK